MYDTRSVTRSLFTFHSVQTGSSVNHYKFFLYVTRLLVSLRCPAPFFRHEALEVLLHRDICILKSLLRGPPTWGRATCVYPVSFPFSLSFSSEEERTETRSYSFSPWWDSTPSLACWVPVTRTGLVTHGKKGPRYPRLRKGLVLGRESKGHFGVPKVNGSQELLESFEEGHRRGTSPTRTDRVRTAPDPPRPCRRDVRERPRRGTSGEKWWTRQVVGRVSGQGLFMSKGKFVTLW